jgi:hypothetical protein
MRHFILFFLACHFPTWALAATYYVDSDNCVSGCAEYDPINQSCGAGPFLCFDSIDRAMHDMAENDELIIQPGTYRSATFADIPTGIAIKGATGSADDVIIDMEGRPWVYAGNTDNLRFEDMTIKNGSPNDSVFHFLSGCNNFLIDNIKFVDCGGAVRTDQSDGAISRCEFRGNSNNLPAIQANDSTNLVIQYSVFRPSGPNHASYVLCNVSSSGSLRIYNCYFSGWDKYAIYVEGGDDFFEIRNCIFGTGGGYSSALGQSAFQFRSSMSPSSIVDNNLIVANPDGTKWDSGGFITDYHELNELPRINGYSQGGIFTLTIDDTGNYDDALWAAQSAERYGYHISFAPYTYGESWYKTGGYPWRDDVKKAIAYLINNQHDVACHSRSHSHLDNTDVFELTHPTATMTISVDQSAERSDNWTGTLHLSTGEAIRLEDPNYNNIGMLVDYLSGLEGYTCTVSPAMSKGTKSVCLANVADQSLSGGYTAHVDQTKFLEVEIAEAKEGLETLIRGLPNEGYSCPACADYEIVTWVSPYNVGTTELMDAVHDAGFKIARMSNPRLVYPRYSLNELAIYSCYCVSYRQISLIDENGKNVLDAGKAGGTIMFAAEHGAMMNLFLHDLPITYEDQGTENGKMNRSDIAELFDMLYDAKSGFFVIGSLRDAWDYMNKNGAIIRGENDGSDRRHRLIPIDNFDGHLMPNSPCVDAGADLGLVEDYEGKEVPIDGDMDGVALVDVGPFEFAGLCEASVDIREPTTLNGTDSLSVVIGLDARGLSGQEADWWLAAHTPLGWYYYDLRQGTWVPGFSFLAYQGVLFDLPPLELPFPDLPGGSSTFYFGIDTTMNGELDNDLYYDSIAVEVSSPN